jgi:hypothetical protein
VLVCLCPCGFDNPRNTLRWKLLQLASVRLWINLLGLRTANMDRCLGVDPLGQHVAPRLRYGILNRELWICVLFESKGERCGYTWDPPGARGAWDGESLPECKTDPKEPLWMACSHLLAGVATWRHSSHWKVMKPLCVGTWHNPLTSVKLSWYRCS